jgi:hypothetical protein
MINGKIKSLSNSGEDAEQVIAPKPPKRSFYQKSSVSAAW